VLILSARLVGKNDDDAGKPFESKMDAFEAFIARATKYRALPLAPSRVVAALPPYCVAPPPASASTGQGEVRDSFHPFAPSATHPPPLPPSQIPASSFDWSPNRSPQHQDFPSPHLTRGRALTTFPQAPPPTQPSQDVTPSQAATEFDEDDLPNDVLEQMMVDLERRQSGGNTSVPSPPMRLVLVDDLPHAHDKLQRARLVAAIQVRHTAG
jgi:hypothetical protein